MYIGRDCRYLAKQEIYGLQNIEVEFSDGQVQNDRPTLRSNFHMPEPGHLQQTDIQVLCFAFTWR